MIEFARSEIQSPVIAPLTLNRSGQQFERRRRVELLSRTGTATQKNCQPLPLCT